ncbi:unnamed protein product [Phytophthora fragariaefolia]|uniref:Unnamed protein product n=1 Tax=Phytophthora fragariaefolia TaxID=1490495 RepID=A0A9W6WV32_9STRA|nr:unnamed protein product [Phytophthora fragariaefolia]
MLDKIEPLALFSEWSPPRQLSEEKVIPKDVTSSSTFDDHHSASNILDNGSRFWKSGSKTEENSIQSTEWIACQFASAVTLSSIELKWQADFVPERFSISISRDGMSYETVAIVMGRTAINRILLPKVRAAAALSLRVGYIKIIVIMLVVGKHGDFLQSNNVFFQFCRSTHTSTGVVLQNIQKWLFDAAVSTVPEVRDLALQALQKLLLASGSLCGLLQLATCLVLNTRVGSSSAVVDIDSRTWNRLDELSADAQYSAHCFLVELARAIQRVVVETQSQNDQKPLLDKHAVEKLFMLSEEIHVSENQSSSTVSAVKWIGAPSCMNSCN